MGRRAVAFDLDGTLLTLPVPWPELKLRVSRALARPVHSFRDLFRELWGTEDYWKVSSMIEEAEIEAVPESAMFPEARTILERLATRFDVYLITLQSRRAADAALRFHGIRRLFRGLITREDGPDRPSQARILVRQVGRALSLVDDHLDQLVEVQAAGLGLREIWVCREGPIDCVRRAERLGFRGDVVRSLREVPLLLGGG